jgi:hypothetical protein
MNQPLAMNRWEVMERWTGFLLFGYLLLGRSFAYLGVSPLFIGEASLAAYLVLRPRYLTWPWLTSLLTSTRLSALSCWLAIGILFAATQIARSVVSGSLTITTLQNAVFHFYPLFLLPGIYLGHRHPQVLPRWLHALAWCNGLYGLAYICVLSPLGLGGSVERPHEIPWFGQPGACAAVMLGLLCWPRHWSRSLPPMALNLVVLLGMQRRAEWLSIMAGVALWTYLTNRVGRALSILAALAVLLVVGLVTDVKLPSPKTRGGQLSARDLVARALAPLNEEAAAELSRDADFYAATASWRSDWWNEIWIRAHSMPRLAFVGAGYHDALWKLHPEDLRDNPVRTPHGILFFILGYTGWVGMIVFVGLQFSLARLLWDSYRASGKPFGICYWLLVIVWSVFDTFLETPYDGIPTYLLLGIAAAPALSLTRSVGPSASQPACVDSPRKVAAT